MKGIVWSICIGMLVLTMTACAPGDELSTSADSAVGSVSPSESAAVSAPPETAMAVNLQELQSQETQWETISAENGYVLVKWSGEVVNLALLEEWISAFEGGQPAEAVLLVSGATIPIAYQLTCDGGKEYTVRWFGTSEASYSADTIYKRNFDYVFGNIEVQHFKGPLTVPTMLVGEVFSESKPTDWNYAITEADAQKVAKDASAGVRQYVEAKNGVNGLGIRINADIREAAPESVYTKVSSYCQLYGSPCYVVELFQNKENMEDGALYDRIAISGDGRWMLLGNLGEGGWIPVCDLEEQVITRSL